MLSKEEYSKENLLSALNLLDCSRKCSQCKYYSPDDIQKCQEPTPYAVDLLKEFIQEHFEMLEYIKKLQDEVDKYKHEYYAMCDLIESEKFEKVLNEPHGTD